MECGLGWGGEVIEVILVGNGRDDLSIGDGGDGREDDIGGYLGLTGFYDGWIWGRRYGGG